MTVDVHTHLDNNEGGDLANYPRLNGRSGGQTLHGGTSADQPLVLKGSLSQMHGPVLINPDGGRVGIGTDAPDNNVVKVVGAIGGQGRAGIFIAPTQGNVGGTQYGLLAHSAGKAGNGADHFMAIGIHGGTLDNYKASLWVSPDQQRPGLNVGFANTVTAPVFGAVFNGNVGIGNSAPRTLLDVGTSSAAFAASATDTRLYVSRAGATNVVVRNNSDNVEMLVRAGADAGAVGTVSNHPLALWTNNAERVRIAEGGNVGIGNANPGAALDVSGAMRIRGGQNGVFTNPGVLAFKRPAIGPLSLTFHDDDGTHLSRIQASDIGLSLNQNSGSISLGIGVGLNQKTALRATDSANWLGGDLAVGFHTTSWIPQGPLHVRHDKHQENGNLLFRAVNVAGSPVTIITNTNGGFIPDVWAGHVLIHSQPPFTGASSLYHSQLLMVEKNNWHTINVGSAGDQLKFSVINNELIIERSAGTRTYEVATLGMWV